MSIHRNAIAFMLGALALGAVGCNFLDKALNVESPSRLKATELEKPQNAPLLVTSTEADLECALGAYIVAGGLMSGEFVETTETASRWSYDRRVIDASESHYSTFTCEAIGVYTPVSTARWTADNAVRHLQGWTDAEVANRQQLIARASIAAGYGLILLGEGFCSAAIDVGPEMTPAQLFAEAESRFTAAITAATAASDTRLRYAALVGRARSRIDRNDKAGAAADAALVPVGFTYKLAAAENGRLQNRVYEQNNYGLEVSVAPAYRNVTYAGNPDPRVEVTDEGRAAADAETPLFTQQRYTSLTDSLIVASGVEAQLILAEAQGGSQAVNIINALHTYAGIPADFASTDATVIRNQVIEERRRFLFVQGQHLYDQNRFNLTLTPAVGTDYPKGGKYGDQRCMPLPDVERLNNPNIG
jgi:hypothetical protein